MKKFIGINSAADFRSWLATAALGDELVWHVGDLAAETDGEAWSKDRVTRLNEIIDEVLAAKNDGRVKLLQERIPIKGSSQHIARRIS